MANEAKLHKNRTCKACGATHYTTAKGIAERERVCAAAIKLGLIIPGSELVLPDQVDKRIILP